MKYNPNQTIYEEENSLFGRKTLKKFNKIYDEIIELGMLSYFEFITRYDSTIGRSIIDTVIITVKVLERILDEPDIKARQDLKEQIEELALNMQTEGVDFLTHKIQFIEVVDITV